MFQPQNNQKLCGHSKFKYAAQKHELQRVKDKCVVLQKMSQVVMVAIPLVH